MKETPGLTGLGVVAFVELVHQVVPSLTLGQFCAAAVQDRRVTVWLLVDLVDDAVENRHCG
ncbi:hypothetical protein D3C84_988400 [compost metagenome]